MYSKRLIPNLLLIVLILGFVNLQNIQANEQSRPAYITRNDLFEKSIILQSEAKTDNDIKNGIEILETIKCGKSNGDLNANGTIPGLFEYPWMTLLIYFDGFVRAPGCDGSLISERYVLTAAHCVRMESKDLVSVRLGEYNTLETKDCTGNGIKRKCASPVQEIDVEEAIYHKDYDPTSISFIDDIGIVRMKQKAVFRSNISPICLPIKHQSKKGQQKMMFVAGWDRLEKDRKSSMPFKAIVPVIDNETCQGIHIFIDLNEKHMCVGEDNVVNSYCKGDSGTAMFNTAPNTYNGNQRFVQYGIISRYGSFCNSMLPHLYVKVEPYIPWIAGNVHH